MFVADRRQSISSINIGIGEFALISGSPPSGVMPGHMPSISSLHSRTRDRKLFLQHSGCGIW
ncbi:MAG: hypothetical protein ACXV3U_08665 [Halobacteriota archaeon]